MEHNLKAFKSDRFDALNASNLSLFLYPTILHIFVKDKKGIILALFSLSDFDWNSFEALIQSESILHARLPAKIFLHNQSFCLVPDAVFSEENCQTYLSFTTPPLSKSTHFSTPLNRNRLHLVSEISVEWKQNLEERINITGYHHGAASFLSYIFKKKTDQIEQEIMVSSYDSHAYFAVTADHDLIAFNRFEIKKDADILKFSTILIHQLKLDPNLVRLSIFSDQKEEFPRLYFEQYFRQVHLIELEGNQNYTPGFQHPAPSNLLEASWQIF